LDLVFSAELSTLPHGPKLLQDRQSQGFDKGADLLARRHV
jgi:hypothetical protein